MRRPRRRSAPPTPWPGRCTASGATRRPAQAVRRGAPTRVGRPAFRYHPGAISAALGDTAGARRDLEMALATDPGSRRRAPPRPAGSSRRCRTDGPSTDCSSNRHGVAYPPPTAPDGGRDPFSCTAQVQTPRKVVGPAAASSGRDCLVHSIESRRPRRRSPHRGVVRRPASSRPATGRRRSSRATPPPTTRTCTRS